MRAYIQKWFFQCVLLLTPLILAAASPQGCDPTQVKYRGDLRVWDSELFSGRNGALPRGTYPAVLEVNENFDSKKETFRSGKSSYSIGISFPKEGTITYVKGEDVQLSFADGTHELMVSGSIWGGLGPYKRTYFLGTANLSDNTLTAFAFYAASAGSSTLVEVASAGNLPESILSKWISAKERGLTSPSRLAER